MGMRDRGPGYGAEAGGFDVSWVGESEGIGGWGWGVRVEAGD
jgi:hypothetical protein